MTRIFGICAIATFAIAAFGLASADASVIAPNTTVGNAVVLSLPGGMPTQLSGTETVAGVGSLPSTSTGIGTDLGLITGFAVMAAALVGGAIVLAVRRER